MHNKRVIQFLFIAAIMLIPGVLAQKAEALPGGTWASGIKIQNLSTTDTATLIVRLYQPGGALAYTLTKDSTNTSLLQASPNGSVELYLPNYGGVAGGRYAAVVSSNTQIGAVATQTDYAYGLADSYNGMEGATTLYVPNIYRAYGNWSTEVFVQNTTSSPVHVYASVFGSANGVGNSVKGFYTKTLNGNGSDSWDFSLAGFSGLGTTFFGSAVITSTENAPLAVAVNNARVMATGDANGNLLVEMRGLTATDGGNHIVLPSLYNAFAGANGTWGSMIRIQNITASPATVNVYLTADPDRPAWTGSKTGLVIGARTTLTFDLNTMTLNGGSKTPAMFKGSAVINATIGQVVASVQQVNYTAQGGKGVANGYFGFSTGFTRLYAPSLYSGWPRCSGVWVSGIKLQNVGAADVTATVVFKSDPDSPNPSWTGTRSGLAIPKDKSVELYLNNAILNSSGRLPTPWKGSASVTFTGSGQLVGTVLHTNYACHVANMYAMVGQ